jgi:ribonucleoside-diphosphate reductase beta chain
MTNQTHQTSFTDIKQTELDIKQTVFNIEKTDYYTPKLFSGQPPGVFNTLNTSHPQIEKLFKKQKAQDWDEQETLENSDAKILFKTLPADHNEPMIRTLGFQWETDTLAGRNIALFGALACTYDQLYEIYIRIADNENLHARTYSEIIKTSFDDPEAVLSKILQARETLQRLKKAGSVFSKMRRTLCEVELGLRQKDEHYYKEIYLFIITLYCIERIQFLSSFAVTFLYGENGEYIEIANSVKKICIDEYEIHVRLGKYVLSKFAEDAITLEAKMLAQPEVKEIIDEVYEAEMASLHYQLETVKQTGLFGYYIEDFETWVRYCAADVYKTVNIEPPFVVPETHRLTYMDTWLNNDNFQQAPQEEDSINYIFGPLIRDDKNKIYPINF